MNSEKSEKKRLSLRQSDKVILIVLAVLIVATIAVNVLYRCGLSLINGALMLYLPLLSLAVLVGWGGYALIRRIKKRVVKTAVASVSVLLMLLAVALLFSYVSYMAYYTIPQRYSTVASPDGTRKLVVLRTFDLDSERSDARRAARLADDPEGDPELTAEDVVVAYQAYPQVLNLFYRNNADVEGEVYLAYGAPAAAETAEGESEATEPAPHGTLMLEWLDDNATAHFYANDPGVSEGGDCYVRF